MAAKLPIKKQMNTLHEWRIENDLIIVAIITWPHEKPSQKKQKNSDITVFRVSDLLKWLMFMQNFEHGVTVFNQ